MSPEPESANNQALLKQQWRLWLLALSFFTRLPVKHSGEINASMLNEASRYFALVGVLIGAVAALVFYFFALLLPVELALLLAMVASVLLTGAFHEDGWADVWDGFGGGWTLENKLNIMKDSRLGTYGAAALFFILLLKYQALVALLPTLAEVNRVPDEGLSLLTIFILGHGLSRVVATSLIADMTYVSEDANTKVKPLAQTLSSQSYLILLATGAIIMACTLSFTLAWQLLLVLWLTRWALKNWFNHQLGGYTGDCLGAAQQLSEVVIYLALIVLTSVAP
ncbi:cobalamin-5'-phosphate synthase [Colwellia chukchiensis]|uniref:Adenosylcobinamide-GDP ribazoletransferase n=1 Tax=Colwellia chukchiensis TaxID=641665 RepID=A0A1H7NF94_9GAMM|nr:adenosylcobinamide-GDP ribazoletransferase [Colwellia chukchiensis]SEL21577.1 cobalamin-5'-phosphate synthase [Colwellia chukchiensis]